MVRDFDNIHKVGNLNFITIDMTKKNVKNNLI